MVAPKQSAYLWFSLSAVASPDWCIHYTLLPDVGFQTMIHGGLGSILLPYQSREANS